MAVVQIPNHGHCPSCGTAIPYVSTSSEDASERTCSKKCAAQFEARRKQGKRLRMFMYIMMGVFVVYLVLSLVNPAALGG